RLGDHPVVWRQSIEGRGQGPRGRYPQLQEGRFRRARRRVATRAAGGNFPQLSAQSQRSLKNCPPPSRGDQLHTFVSRVSHAPQGSRGNGVGRTSVQAVQIGRAHV